MRISGTVVLVGDNSQVTEKLKKRELWVEMAEGSHPQTISIEFIQGWTDLLNDLVRGDKVDVDFNLRGRIYKNKVYNTLSGYKIDVTTAVARVTPPDDDLPF